MAAAVPRQMLASALLALAALCVVLVVLVFGRAFAVLFAAHFGVTWWLASHDFFRVTTLPPRIPLFALGTVGVGLLAFRALRPALPPVHVVIAFQSFRFVLELVLFALWRAHELPRQMTFEGQNFDVLVGVSAPVVAWLVATQRLGPLGAKVWNGVGVALLINVLRVAITSFPGPLNTGWPGEPLTLVAQWPFVLIPALLVPLAVWAHLLTAAALTAATATQGARSPS